MPSNASKKLWTANLWACVWNWCQHNLHVVVLHCAKSNAITTMNDVCERFGLLDRPRLSRAIHPTRARNTGVKQCPLFSSTESRAVELQICRTSCGSSTAQRSENARWEVARANVFCIFVPLQSAHVPSCCLRIGSNSEKLAIRCSGLQKHGNRLQSQLHHETSTAGLWIEHAAPARRKRINEMLLTLTSERRATVSPKRTGPLSLRK